MITYQPVPQSDQARKVLVLAAKALGIMVIAIAAMIVLGALVLGVGPEIDTSTSAGLLTI